MSPAALRRLFFWLTLLETVTLVVLVVNRLGRHNEVITSSVGPVHGILYAACIAVVLMIPKVPTRIRAMTVLPVFGAPVAWWMLRRERV